MRNPPNHIKNAGDFEPLYPPQEFILEESLRREAERVVHQDNLLNRVVYDSIDPSPYTGAAAAADGGGDDDGWAAVMQQPQPGKKGKQKGARKKKKKKKGRKKR